MKTLRIYLEEGGELKARIPEDAGVNAERSLGGWALGDFIAEILQEEEI